LKLGTPLNYFYLKVMKDDLIEPSGDFHIPFCDFRPLAEQGAAANP
jgi:hypothetical protein